MSLDTAAERYRETALVNTRSQNESAIIITHVIIAVVAPVLYTHISDFGNKNWAIFR